MKVQSASSVASSSSARQAFYSKKRSPPCSLSKSRNGSPLRESVRRTPPELVAAEVLRQSAARIAKAEREMQHLLEHEYRADVEDYMHEMEDKTMASVDLIDQQPELQWYMRPYLVDFLIEIHQQHRLRPETLYLAINIVDRYVSKRIVFKKHYQLVGCAALWIAAKFEDAKDRVPSVPELCQMCCSAYDESAFIQMEGHVLSTINWVVGHPTTESWLRLACVSGPLEEQRTQHVARFVMEITLFHKEYISFKPSVLAKASLMLARFMLGKTRRIQDESDEVLRAATLLDLQLGEHLESVSAIVVKKYSMPFYSRASTFAREWYLSGRRFSYYDWSNPAASATPNRLLAGKAGSPIAPSSSSSLPSPATRRARSRGDDLSSPSSASSASENSDEDDDSIDEDDREPLTPLDPFGPYSAATDYSSVPMSLCNSTGSSSSLCNSTGPSSLLSVSTAMSRSSSLQSVKSGHSHNHAGSKIGHAQMGYRGVRPAVRAPLEQATWEVNAQRGAFRQ